MNNINTFWRGWLFWTTIGLTLFGLAFVLLPYEMQALYNQILFSGFPKSMTGMDAKFGPQAIRYIAFVYGVLGAVLVGWAVLLLGVIKLVLPENEKRAWQVIALAIAVWFPVDSGFSIIMGFHMNAVMNVGFLFMYGLPLGVVYKQVFARGDEH